MDRTLILVKPDAFARGLTGEIIARFERKGLQHRRPQAADHAARLAETHYAEHAERPFFGELVDFITSAPLVAMVLEGDEAVEGRPPADRRHEPARGHHRLDPRRLRDRGRPEHGPRLGLAGVGRARDRRSGSRSSDAPRSPAARRSGARSSRRSACRSGVDVDVDEIEEGTGAEVALDQRPAQGAGGRAAGEPATLVLGVDTLVALDGAIWGKPADAAAARADAAGAERAHARGRQRRRAGRRRQLGASQRTTRVTFRELDEPRRLVPGHRGMARTGRRLRDPGPRRRARAHGSRATTSTSSGCRSAGSRAAAADLQPFLLKRT